MTYQKLCKTLYSLDGSTKLYTRVELTKKIGIQSNQFKTYDGMTAEKIRYKGRWLELKAIWVWDAWIDGMLCVKNALTQREIADRLHYSESRVGKATSAGEKTRGLKVRGRYKDYEGEFSR